MDSFDFSSNLESTFRVKIEGRLLEDDDDLDKDEDEEDWAEAGADKDADADRMDTDAPEKTRSAAPKQRHRFSHFFKALTVEFDRSRMHNGTEQIVEWRKPEKTPSSSVPAGADFDEFTFKRNGDENVNIAIYLTRHEDPERFELSPELAEIVDMTEATRPEITMGLWEYIKLMSLQEDEEKRNFRCDELLRRVCIYRCSFRRRPGIVLLTV